MLVKITGKHVEITDAIRAHVEDKALKLPRYFSSISEIEVIVEGNEGIMKSVELVVSVEHSADLVAKEKGPDMYACIDLVMHKMEQQLRKIKEKQRDNKHVSPAERERLAERAAIQEDVA